MVAGISASNNFFLMLNKINLAKNNKENVEATPCEKMDFYSPYNDDFYRYCMNQDVDNLDKFKSFVEKSDYVSADYNYDEEFKKYLKSTGCNNEEELTELVRTNYSDKLSLQQFIAQKIMREVGVMKLNGSIEPQAELSSSECENLVKNIDISDLSDLSMSPSGRNITSSLELMQNILNKLVDDKKLDNTLTKKVSDFTKLLDINIEQTRNTSLPSSIIDNRDPAERLYENKKRMDVIGKQIDVLKAKELSTSKENESFKTAFIKGLQFDNEYSSKEYLQKYNTKLIDNYMSVFG